MTNASASRRKPAAAITHRNHFVARWHQRRFLPAGVTRFFYLDLKPDIIPGSGGKRRRALLRWGPARCFCADNLYTLKLGYWHTDAVEHRFFGPIDARGEKAVSFMSDYGMREGAPEAFNAMMYFMSAQRFRTRRGLDYLGYVTKLHDQNLVLAAMARLFQANATMWTEGVWEIVRARESATKFIITDEPVTFYNPRSFPLSPSIPYPLDADLSEIGTRKLFPLGIDACLIITHLQLVRDPLCKPKRARTNARAFAPAMFDLRSIQTGRELVEDEVRRINFILKRRATRYIAAAEEQWLYPEDFASVTHWSKLDNDWFMLPNLYCAKFSRGIAVGYKDGSSWAADEYGRSRRHPDYESKTQRDRELITFQQAKLAWALKREGRSLARNHDDFADANERMMREDVAEFRAKKGS